MLFRSVFRLVKFSKPLGIVTELDTNSSGSGTVQAQCKVVNEEQVISLSGSDSKLRQLWQLSSVRFTKPPMPSEIAAKIDMCENGSEMVQAKYKVKCEKINDLTFGN